MELSDGFGKYPSELASADNEVDPRDAGHSLTQRDEIMLDDLEDEIEIKINDSIDDESIELINESSNVGGFNYENTVIGAIKLAGLSGNITSGAGANATAADADIKLNGQIYNIEVKLDADAQMGGSSVRFGSGGISLVKPVDPGTKTLLIDAVSSKSRELNRLISFLSKQKPLAINKTVSGFPLSCTTDAWTSAKTNGLLVNIKIKYTTDFIAKHYAKKGIFYIQLGQAGLFYLAGNPANLPIPELVGEIDIEIRSARSGSKLLASGIPVIGGGIRVQARLKTKGKSPYTADDLDSLLAMIEEMKLRDQVST